MLLSKSHSSPVLQRRILPTAPQTAELALGDECYANFSLLGDCVNSYCDMMGSNICEPMRAEGEACTFPYECTTGACDAGTCATNRMCVGG